ncbi:MAG: glycosyltransferase family 4 protein [Saprospiraceae bacterium]|nr:glycosyltransferase family 4 protein [Saprospiraceae bacterium]
MKKLLIISYYWPPSGGSGVQRWLYFVKYLRSFGWEPIIYTVEKGEYPYLDPELGKLIPEGIEVIRKPIWEPYFIFKKIRGGNKAVDPTIMSVGKKQSIFHKLAFWIRGNLFIPDPRIFWLKPSVSYLCDYLQQHPVDLLVSTGPPHSMHLIAQKLKRKLQIPWIADFRDPWTQIFYFDTLRLSSFARYIHQHLERSVLKNADAIITVSPSCKEGLELICNRNVEVITNGYEPFEKIDLIKNEKDKIILLYSGVLTLDRNPELFWIKLKEYVDQHPELKDRLELQFIGNVDPAIIEYIKKFGIFHLDHFSPMPHKQLEHYLWKADLLLLIGVPGNNGVVTGKFFEYLFLNKPILSVAPEESDLASLLNQTQSGFNADFEDPVRMQEMIESAFCALLNDSYKPDVKSVAAYSRKNLTSQLADLMNTVLMEKQQD